MGNIGILYSTGTTNGAYYYSSTTKEGIAYKNGFGSVYAISGISPNYSSPTNTLDLARINTVGFNESILETEGFIFWTKFNILSSGSTNIRYFESDGTYYGSVVSGFSFGISNNIMSFTLYNSNNAPVIATIPFSKNLTQPINISSDTTSFFNVLIYKDPSKNYTQVSAFTTYANNYKNVVVALPYIWNKIIVKNVQCFFAGSFGATNDCIGINMNIFNLGMSKTTMTPTEFDLFAQKMLKHDNYWHLFENETDTPNIKQSDIIFYLPFYQKFGGNSSSSRINFMYPKSTTKYAYIYTASPNISRMKLTPTLGNNNRWRKPYPPYEPYI